MATDGSTRAKTKLNLEMRRILGDAYSFVRGADYNRAAANISYEELLDAAIGRINGTDGSGDLRPTKLERVKQIKEEITRTVETVKGQPPSAWMIENQDVSVEKEDQAVTAEDPEEDEDIG